MFENWKSFQNVKISSEEKISKIVMKFQVEKKGAILLVWKWNKNIHKWKNHLKIYV